MWPIESMYSFSVYTKPEKPSMGSTVAGEVANSRVDSIPPAKPAVTMTSQGGISCKTGDGA